MLDTNTLQQLNEWAKRINPKQPILLIDHHAPHPETQSICTLQVTDQTASSTCEIVYRLFKQAKIKPSVESAKGLFLGIAFDSRHFILASSETLKTVAELSQTVNPQETLPILSLPMAYSERVARLKTAGRLKTVKINEGDPVYTRPDIDNYIKSLLDCMEAEDNYIHTISASKRYSKKPRIELYI